MRDWLTKDIYWKGFSVFMAIGIWLTVNQFSQSGEPASGLLSRANTYTNVPVSAVSGMADVHGVQIEPQAVTVTVSGSPDVMAGFDSDRIHVLVNLTGIQSAREIPQRVEVAVPPDVTLLRVDPPDVKVTIPPEK